MQSIKDRSLTTRLFISIFQKPPFSSINRSKTFSFYNSWRITSTLREQNYFWVVRKTSKWRCYKVYTQAHFQLARLKHFNKLQNTNYTMLLRSRTAHLRLSALLSAVMQSAILQKASIISFVHIFAWRK